MAFYVLANIHRCIYSVRREFGDERAREKRRTKGERSRQLCTSRLASGLHLYPHTSYRKEGEPRGPMRQYVPIIFHLVLFHSLAILSFPSSSSSIVDYLVRLDHHVASSRVYIFHLCALTRSRYRHTSIFSQCSFLIIYFPLLFCFLPLDLLLYIVTINWFFFFISLSFLFSSSSIWNFETGKNIFLCFFLCFVFHFRFLFVLSSLFNFIKIYTRAHFRSSSPFSRFVSLVFLVLRPLLSIFFIPTARVSS